MRVCRSVRRSIYAAALAAGCVAGWPLLAQSPVGPAARPGPEVQAAPNGGIPVASVPQNQAQAAPPVQQHPLVPALDLAYKGMAAIKANIKDYSCTMIKRERIDGKLGDPNFMFVKVRHQPFSVYMYFLKPDDVKGREVIYVQGANNGNLLAHEGSGLKSHFGMVSLNPTSAMAMDGNRYPITMLGIWNLTARLIEVAEHDKQYGECDVQFRRNAKVNDRVCTIIEVTHPVPRRNFQFHKAVIYIDDQLTVPIRYEAYSWPTVQGGPPVLDEEYTYLNLKTNIGLTDADFDPRSPSYRFK